MPKGRVQLKYLGKGKAKEMTAVFEEMFRPNPQNVHIYIQKINDLSKIYKRIAIMLRNMDANLAGGRIYSAGRQQLNAEDKQYFKQLKEIKIRLKAEMAAKKQSPSINYVSILMYTDLKTWADLEQIKYLSLYFNGEVPGTFPHSVIYMGSVLSEAFSKCHGVKASESQTVRYHLMGISKQYEGQLFVGNLALDYFILECAEDEATRDYLFAKILMTVNMMMGEFTSMYKVLKTPEFDIYQVRELVEQAIREFKKSLPGCDLAFYKLLQSLDTFTGNFDYYYEQFNTNGKEPTTLLVGFIDNVQEQYKDLDNAEARKLLRQFNAIKGEFAKRLGNKLDNPIIKGLYDQLCSQLSTAESMVDGEETKKDINQFVDQ